MPVLLDHLTFLYGPDTAPAVYSELLARMNARAADLAGRARSAGPVSLPPENASLRPGEDLLLKGGERAGLRPPNPGGGRPRAISPLAVDQADAVLITYAGQFQDPPRSPLDSLGRFCRQHLSGLVTGIHILPFFPSSSDDGFSVVDYRQVDPAFGGWQEIERLGQDFRLAFDLVANHASQHSAWFRGFLRGDPAYAGWFVTASPAADLSRVVRPRALPLLTRFDTPRGPEWVWTTFSADQVDLNYANPAVLLEMIDVLLEYAARGAELIRLDAIAYLWKEAGTACIHLPQTHRVVQLMRAVLDQAAPGTLLLTETNVPHADNIAYFGDGDNEAHLVYNFALPPLVLHTFLTGSAAPLTAWAAGLRPPGPQNAFFNFLASHDGIGLNPARGLLSDDQIADLVSAVQSRGGLVSYKDTPSGPAPYELNINYFDALAALGGGEPLDQSAARFLASQAVMLALAGLPGIYVHSLLGSRGWPEGARASGHNRAINRQKFSLPELEQELANPASLRARVFGGYARLLRARAGSPAFHPTAPQRVLDLHPAVFSLLRLAPDGQELVLCLHSASPHPLTLPLDLPALGLPPGPWIDRITGHPLTLPARAPLNLAPYETLWLSPSSH